MVSRDEMIRLARAAGWGGDAAEAWADGYEIGATVEREACADVCDHLMDTAITKQMATAYGNAADAIRNKE